jgi:hypothetical protein
MSSPPVDPNNPIPVPTTPDEFRAASPNFADTTTYPDEMIQLYLNAASLLLPACVWGRTLGLATVLFVNHNLTLFAQQFPNGIGSTPVPLRGPVQSETAGALSVSYDMQAVLDPDAGWWNYTPYGQLFYRLMMIFGAGPRQINVPPWGGACGCFDYGAFARSSLSGMVGPGWGNPASNVPVSKFLPPTGTPPTIL